MKTWIQEGITDYAELTLGAILGHGRFGRVVKPLVDRDGWDKVRAAWRAFVQYFVKLDQIQYATPEYFARTYPKWVVKPLPTRPPAPQFREVLEGNRMRFVADG